MNFKLFLSFLLFTQLVFSQKEIALGIGVLSVDIYQNPELKFYADKNKTSLVNWCKIDSSTGEFLFEQNDSELEWLEPESLWLDYSILDFRVVQKSGNWYQVFVHNLKEIKLWIQIDEKMKYQDWTNFFRNNVSNVSKIENIAQDVKSQANESSNSITAFDKGHCFEVIEVKGDWLKIKSHTILECDFSTHPIKSGWIRWRKDNRLLIAYGQVC